MKEANKVRQISKKEAKQIDPTKVAYFTLNDGTVFIVKDNINKEKQGQIQMSSESEQVNIQTQSQNVQELTQQESNYRYNTSHEGEDIQNYFCNAKLINARIITQTNFGQQGQKKQLYKLIEAIPVRFCDMQGTQLMNQSTHSQINLQQYNNDTYVVEKSYGDNHSTNYQVNTQNSGMKCNCGRKIEMKCCCPIGNPAIREEMEIVSPEYVEQLKKKKNLK